MFQEPAFTYLTDKIPLSKENIIGKMPKLIKRHGRAGYIAESIHTRIILSNHTANCECGTASLWVMPLEDMDSMTHQPYFSVNNENYGNFCLLADSPVPGDFEGSIFSICYSNHWYPQLYAKFCKGSLRDGLTPVLKGVIGAGHFRLHKDEWYQIVLSWDRTTGAIVLYANGVLVARGDTLHGKLSFDDAKETLYTGNPNMAMSQIEFFDYMMTDSQVNSLFESEAIIKNENLQYELRHTYSGFDMPSFSFTPSDKWELKCDKPMNEKEDLDYFYIQGKTDAAHLTDDGVLIETDQNMLVSFADIPDKSACYLWTEDFFSGDLYVEYEFKPLKRDGLSLIMVQCSGMQREDFMNDYPRKTNGSMMTVCWENVRNYHWEYFRNVVDTRSDTASHVFTKNPWGYPMGYSCQDKKLEINKWHKLQLLQEDNHIRCAIDGVLVLDITDNSFINNGPVLNCGRIAIRCMIRTKLLLRNFKVWNKEK